MRDPLTGVYQTDADVESLEGLDQDAPIVSYCRTGMMACIATVFLKEKGFTNIRMYDGSWTEWGQQEDTKDLDEPE